GTGRGRAQRPPGAGHGLPSLCLRQRLPGADLGGRPRRGPGGDDPAATAVGAVVGAVGRELPLRGLPAALPTGCPRAAFPRVAVPAIVSAGLALLPRRH